MSELPEGVDLSGFVRKPPRPTATMTLTRDGPNGLKFYLAYAVKPWRPSLVIGHLLVGEYLESILLQLNPFPFLMLNMVKPLLAYFERLVKSLD